MFNLYYAKIGAFSPQDADVKILAQLDNFKSSVKRKKFLTGRVLLDKVLKQQEIEHYELQENEFGKPYLTALPLFFSLSYAGDYCVCLVSEHEVGVDVEKTAEAVIKVAKRLLNAAEYQNHLVTPLGQAELMKQWVLKEAFVKYIGKGMSVDFRQVNIQKTAQRNSFLLSFGEVCAEARLINCGEYYLAFCAKEIGKRSIKMEEIN